MDKKTNLTPELKEIYDRVMNTTAKAPATTLESNPTSNGAPQPTTASPTPPSAPTDQSAPAMPTTPTPTDTAPSVPKLDPAPTIGEQPKPVDSTPAPSMPPPQPPTQDTGLHMPQVDTPTPAEQALTSTPARPITDGNSFSFNGTAPAAPQPAAATDAKAAKKKTKISMPIIIALAVVFIAVWGVFWALIFEIIPR